VNPEGVDHDEQSGEHYEQAPIDLAIHFLRLDPVEQNDGGGTKGYQL